jgi:predicted small secreted protein
MRSQVQAGLSVRVLSMAVGALLLSGCSTWGGLGKDVERTGDAMSGKGTYTTTVHGTPDQVTAAARSAVEQLKMTEIDSSNDRSKGKVTAKTTRADGVRIDIEQVGATDSKMTIYTHGVDADEVSKQIQDQVGRNLR